MLLTYCCMLAYYNGREFQHLLLEFGELLGTVSIGDYVPWLDRLTNKVSGLFERAHRVAKLLNQFINEVIEEHFRNGRGVDVDVDVDVDSEEQNE
ncbi:hypothetical protein D0Y65_018374 [Glycine soja]|uniref:Uncharacterized protein n=1 Tax=Glycine soja TaxID=3848 RepID=A0A445JYW3_GLYSO|nr:hypothetical protein D0Y65_018374 [Glycine soja]